MTRPHDLDARHAWRGALVAAALNAAGMPVDLFLGRNVPGMPWYPALISAGVGLGLIVLLLIGHRGATVRFGSTVFLVNVAVILWSLWITSGYWATTPSWMPFQANKLGALTVALVAPELITGLAAIIGLSGMPIAKFYALDPAIARTFPIGEPWFALIFGLFAAVLLGYRLRSLAFEREVLRLHADAVASERIARTFLHLRHAANTPIQTIVVAAELMRERYPDVPRLLRCIDRAAKRLIELSDVLTRYEAMHKWTPGDESLGEGLPLEEGERLRG
jgi:hypothetical protein